MSSIRSMPSRSMSSKRPMNGEMNDAPADILAIVDLAAELGLTPGSDVTVTGIGWDFTVSTSDPNGIRFAGWQFLPDGLSSAVSREDSPLTVISSSALHSPSGNGNPLVIDGGVLTFVLGGSSFDPIDGSFYNQTDMNWNGEFLLSFEATTVPIPGALIMFFSAFAYLLGFKRTSV